MANKGVFFSSSLFYILLAISLGCLFRRRRRRLSSFSSPFALVHRAHLFAILIYSWPKRTAFKFPIAKNKATKSKEVGIQKKNLFTEEEKNAPCLYIAEMYTTNEQ